MPIDIIGDVERDKLRALRHLFLCCRDASEAHVIDAHDAGDAVFEQFYAIARVHVATQPEAEVYRHIAFL